MQTPTLLLLLLCPRGDQALTVHLHHSPCHPRVQASSALIWIILVLSFALSPIELPLGHQILKPRSDHVAFLI